VSSIRLPLALSITGHAACLALLIFLLSDQALLVPEPIAKAGIEVVFPPTLPKSEAPPLSEPALQPEMPPPPAETPPPERAEVVPPTPKAPAIVSEPTPPAPEAPVATAEPTPPKPRTPLAKKPPKPVQRREEPPQPNQAYLPSAPAPPTPAAPPQTASAATPAPAPVPTPEASAGYRALLSAWLEGHKHYPDSARQRGEEGHAVLRFEVDRNGRVIDYAVTKSSGYSDLDESIEEMMRGATLPPFPAGMPQPRMQVSVTLRFSLRR
jgi:protein TonB